MQPLPYCWVRYRMPLTREKIFVSLGEPEVYLDIDKHTLEINVGFQPILSCSTDSEIFDGFVELLEKICERQLPSSFSHRKGLRYFRLNARVRKPGWFSKYDPESVTLEIFAIGMGPFGTRVVATFSGLSELRTCILEAKERGDIGSMKA